MIVFYSLLLLLIACKPSAEPKPEPKQSWTQPGFTFPYQINEPDHAMTLGKKLMEISGLSQSADEKYLIAIQDENDLIFFIDKKSGKIQESLEFWKDGDYEGVEAVGKEVFVIKSSGTLYQITDLGKEGQKTEKFNSFLNGSYDAEGLAYDAAGRRLLIACKAKAGEGEQYKLMKSIYSFDLESMTLDSLPAYTISLEEVHAYLDTSPSIRKLEKLQEFFKPNQSEFGLSPSGLAIHPFSGDLYIISSVGKMLVVLSPEGKIRHIEKLKKKVHVQPEGICFDAGGQLYISNEGKGGSAKLYRFDVKK